jgi:hypothetical protein
VDDLLTRSRSEIQKSRTMLEIRWDRHMVMEHEHTLDSAEACRPPHPQIGDVTVCQRARHVVEAMHERQLAISNDLDLGHLDPRPAPRPASRPESSMQDSEHPLPMSSSELGRLEAFRDHCLRRFVRTDGDL